jgi:hypothetical protein
VRDEESVASFEKVNMRTVEPIPYRPREPLSPQLAQARERLARVEPGGTPALPIEVDSASQIQLRAESTPCLRCQGPNWLDDHTAEKIDGHAVRVVRVHCHHCGAPRVFYFRVATAA